MTSLVTPFDVHNHHHSQVQLPEMAAGPKLNVAFLSALSERRIAKNNEAPKRRGPRPDSKPPLTRRQELNRLAQRTHRERKEAYIKTLEAEILKLKDLFTSVNREKNAVTEENHQLKNLLIQHGIPIHGMRFQATSVSGAPNPMGVPFSPESFGTSVSSSSGGAMSNFTPAHLVTPPAGQAASHNMADPRVQVSPPSALGINQTGVSFAGAAPMAGPAGASSYHAGGAFGVAQSVSPQQDMFASGPAQNLSLDPSQMQPPLVGMQPFADTNTGLSPPNFPTPSSTISPPASSPTYAQGQQQSFYQHNVPQQSQPNQRGAMPQQQQQQQQQHQQSYPQHGHGHDHDHSQCDHSHPQLSDEQKQIYEQQMRQQYNVLQQQQQQQFLPSGSSPQGPVKSSTGVDIEKTGMQFVLALEQPCMYHLPFLAGESAKGGAFTGHALLASCPPVPFDALNPGDGSAAAAAAAAGPTNGPGTFGTTNIDEAGQKAGQHTWELDPSAMSQLLTLSESYIEGEISPVVAWNRLLRHPRFSELSQTDILDLADQLKGRIRCYGFGATLEEFELDDALSQLFEQRDMAS